jgi:hypothetical protein
VSSVNFPAPKPPGCVDGRHPGLAHGLRLCGIGLIAVALNLDNEAVRRQVAPLIDVLADFVNEDVGCDLVFQRELALVRTAPPGRGNLDDMAAVAAPWRFVAGRLALLVKLELP